MSNNINTNIEEENIPDSVIKAFWAVRDTGLVNMYNCDGVVRVMINKGMCEAAIWLIDAELGKCDINKYAMLLKQIRESTNMISKLIED